ncbi:MAG: hypothetical protein ABF633_10285 [Clostridium sp.]|uniref:hypothetical protein n=1 Tax=Clostridium sp. TaxID=1506 RepID=UPI0039ECAEF0
MFNYVFSYKSINNTSYKFGFFKAIIECVYEVNIEGEILLTDVFARFTRIYWTLIIKHNLKQGSNATRNGKVSINKIFDRYILENQNLINCEYDIIDDDVKKCIEHEVYAECKKYVVGAFYGDTEGCIYSFSLKRNYIKFNPMVLNFIQRYSISLLSLIILNGFHF